tara:strand:+ start:1346 stop:1588 length:243 start_codon:yes stop_codon:yes gene_type:complete
MSAKPPKLFTFTIRMSVEAHHVDEAFATVLDELQDDPGTLFDDVIYDVMDPTDLFSPFYMDDLGLNEDTEVIWTSGDGDA